MQKQPPEAFFKKFVIRDFAEYTHTHTHTHTHTQNMCQNPFFGFLLGILGICKNIFFGEQHRAIIALSLVAKGLLGNETINCETKTKAYVII